MEIIKVLQKILNEIDSHNCDKIVDKYLNQVEVNKIVDKYLNQVEVKVVNIIDGHDLLVQLTKSFENQLFSSYLDDNDNDSVEVDPSDQR